MKKLIIAIALFLSTLSTNAFACTEEALGQAEGNLTRLQELYEVGVVDGLDIQMAKKNVLDLKVCSAQLSGKIYDQVSLLKELGTISDARIKYAKGLIEVGLGTLSYLVSLEAEKAGYLKTCQHILKVNEPRLEVGLITNTYYEEIKSTCKSLE